MIRVSQSDVGLEELNGVIDCFERQWLGLGPKVAEFEQAFARHLACPDEGVVMVNSGSAALEIAVKLLNLPPGSEIILPSWTWPTCAHAIALNGHVPVFCDVALETQNATVEMIDAVRTPKTAAILAVHFAGLPSDVPWAFGLPVIEDCAHAVDSGWRDKPCGRMGTLGCFSFDPVKNLATPDAGCVTAQDTKLLKRAKRLRYAGLDKPSGDRWWEYDVSELHPRCVPNDIAAAIGLAQLTKLPQLQARRKAIWARYQDAFADLEWVIRPVDAMASGTRHSYFTYVVRVPRRDAFARHLYARGIYTTLRFHPLHLKPIYGSTSCLPNCERLNDEALSLPLHPALTDSQVEQIIDAVRQGY